MSNTTNPHASGLTPQAFLKPREIAAALGVDRKRVSAWIKRGELPATLVSSDPNSLRPQYRIRREDLDAFLAARQVRPPRARRQRRRPDYERIV
jgi:excisionase family DNA binding protein